jgi:hypothetical protein
MLMNTDMSNIILLLLKNIVLRILPESKKKKKRTNERGKDGGVRITRFCYFDRDHWKFGIKRNNYDRFKERLRREKSI